MCVCVCVGVGQEETLKFVKVLRVLTITCDYMLGACCPGWRTTCSFSLFFLKMCPCSHDAAILSHKDTCFCFIGSPPLSHSLYNRFACNETLGKPALLTYYITAATTTWQQATVGGSYQFECCECGGENSLWELRFLTFSPACVVEYPPFPTVPIY